MIPNLEWRMVEVGPVMLHVWGFFAALGVVLASMYASRLAKKRGLDAEKIETLIFWILIWVFIGARFFHVAFYQPDHYFEHPMETFAVWRGGLSSFGGFFGAAVSFFWQMRQNHLPLLKTADVLTTALPLGLGCGRIGCFLIHDHPGTMAHGAGQWLAVKCPGGAYYDLGLLLALFDFTLFGVFLYLQRKPRRDGFYFALFMLVYGPVRFLLDFLRVIDVRYHGLTPGQYGSIILAFAGFFMMRRVYAGRATSHA